jgi:hypothetical protein
MRSMIGIFIVLTVAAAPAAAQRQAQPDRFAELDRACEDARLVKLTPLRQQKTEQCVQDTRRSRADCEAEFSTWGNTSQLAGGGARAGLFYDLPECQAAFNARQQQRR